MVDWSSKWNRAMEDRWEDKRALSSDPAEVIAGIRSKDTTKPSLLRGLLDKSGQTGRSETLTAADVGIPKSILRLQSDDQKARMVTVTLGIVAPRDTTYPPVEAQISWGVGGVQANATIDWMKGTTFSVPASFLSVSAVRQVDASGADIQVGAFAAYGSVSIPGPATPRFSQRVPGANIAVAGVSAIQAIPTFASNLWFNRWNGTVPNHPSCQLEFLEPSGVLNSSTYEISAGDIPPVIPIHNLWKFVRVRNLDAVIIGNLDFIWGMSL